MALILVYFLQPQIITHLRWLAAQDRMPEARASLARTRGIPVDEAHQHPILRAEADEIYSNAMKHMRMGGKGWADCFKWEGKMLYRTLLGVSLSLSSLLSVRSIQRSPGCEHKHKAKGNQKEE